MQSGFWLVLPEKSNAGFPVVNPAYLCNCTLWSYMYTTYNDAHHPPQITFEFQQIPSRQSVCMGVVRLRSHLLKVHKILVRPLEFIIGVIKSCRGERTLQDRRLH
ncbi:MAG: hypothetical protein V7L31_11300 [Nostoc sp.]|uniref:hypothetical protein n=1 Tax=Nostoc sp. TaxID=1180 RepID=UPI002FF38CDA